MGTREFYDRLAPYYDMIYGDWESSIERQAAQLNSIVREFSERRANTVLDVSCGIGTQAIGLAKLGYEVTASDISLQEIERARKEALRFGVEIEFSVADMREAFSHHGSQFDVVLSADNSIPHLLSDEDIRKALGELYRCTKEGGICLISVRNYEKESMQSGEIRPYALQERGDRRFILFQVWKAAGSLYELSLYCVEDSGGTACRTEVVRTRYYAIKIPQLVRLLEQAGFKNVSTHHDRFFQPLIVGHRQ